VKYAILVAGLSTLLLSSAALAGPCSEDIASIGKQLSQSPVLGPVTTGTLSGSNPGHASGNNTMAPPEKDGTSASNRVGGTAGTKEMSAASSGVATSDADVRQQQAGHMTGTTGKGVETAPGSQNASRSASNDHMTRAKAAWQKAVDLNARNDTSCKSAVADARTAMQGS
jgi:hypothetical protein